MVPWRNLWRNLRKTLKSITEGIPERATEWILVRTIEGIRRYFIRNSEGTSGEMPEEIEGGILLCSRRTRCYFLLPEVYLVSISYSWLYYIKTINKINGYFKVTETHGHSIWIWAWNLKLKKNISSKTAWRIFLIFFYKLCKKRCFRKKKLKNIVVSSFIQAVQPLVEDGVRDILLEG